MNSSVTNRHNLTAMLEISKYLEERWENENTIRKELKTRSITFFDPYKNPITNICVDHELMGTLIRKYKKDYVPKYLQKWIKFGTMAENVILPLYDDKLKSTVSQYPDGYQFITYDELNIHVEYCESIPHQQSVLQVILKDKIENIRIKMQELLKLPNIQLKSFILNRDFQIEKLNRNDGTILKTDDTVMSSKLYQDQFIIIAKILQGNYYFFLFSNTILLS
ncbi:unnamed protein product [Rotaria sp. Silwood2]|nr:unnamed protein product [Rotaria sp. Silwood2]CAF3206395.1 unnamed protein product [Rotaria sp. Silwood2]CAF4568862.1 unnamed protein product [Rotaria sp. Silwood2]CAF4578597.1 unnamed protein product [Rotaria sp. Silwood2]